MGGGESGAVRGRLESRSEKVKSGFDAHAGV